MPIPNNNEKIETNLYSEQHREGDEENQLFARNPAAGHRLLGVNLIFRVFGFESICHPRRTLQFYKGLVENHTMRGWLRTG